MRFRVAVRDDHALLHSQFGSSSRRSDPDYAGLRPSPVTKASQDLHLAHSASSFVELAVCFGARVLRGFYGGVGRGS